MSRLQWRVSITSTVSDVWGHLVDWEQMPTWFLGVRRVQLLAAEPRVGAARVLYLGLGSRHREQITRWEPPTGFSIAVVDPPFIGRDWVADVDLREHPAGVELSWDLRYEPRYGPIGRVVDSLFVRPCIDIAFRVSLRRLRDTIEARRAGEGGS